MWDDYCAASGTDPSPEPAVEPFGDSAELADELLQLVLHGPKRATAGLLRDFGDEPLPEPGSHWVVLDGRGEPACVLRTSEVRVGLVETVDDAFAHDEGEGDRTRAWWLEAHRAFFGRQPGGFDEARDLVVFERFELVWPPGPGA
jgi:uncharacterized protein YhfF